MYLTMYRKPQNSTKKTARINEFSEVAGYQINVHISVLFLYINDEAAKEKLRKQYHLQLYQKE